MSRLAVVCLSFLLWVGCATTVVVPVKPQHVIDESPVGVVNLDHNRLASVRVDLEGGGHGSGFFVSKFGHVVTAYHVVDGGKPFALLIKRTDGSSFSRPATLLAFDKSNDLALLKVEHVPSHVAILAKDSEMLTGDEIYVSGYPYSHGELVTRGWLMSRCYAPSCEVGNMAGMLVMQVLGGSGYSGSGVFLAKNGHLIGVWQLVLTSAKASNGHTMSVHMARSVVKLHAFLKAHHVPLVTEPAVDSVK